MAPTLSLGLGDFSRAEIGNLPASTPECPMALSPGGRVVTINGDGFRLASFSRNHSNRHCKRRSRARATPPRGQRQGFGPGDRR
jgi:hypothetical protein